jgi:NAD(P) transhydrogenase subunit beta
VDTENLRTFVYLVAAVLFIRSLGGLSAQESARQGNRAGMIGMVLAILATALDPEVGLSPWVLLPMASGLALGAWFASGVAMTAMPELVALLHSFVGMAAVLVGFADLLEHETVDVVRRVETWADVCVGALTFTGSVVAWGKLRGTISGKPRMLPARQLSNGLLLFGMAALGVPMLSASPWAAAPFLLGSALLAGALGVHVVMAIGGADMPVVVSLLNSASGWAAAAAGFMLGNDLLIVTGALVGSSGLILSIIMCRAMNRSIWNVVAGGFGGESKASAAVEGEVRRIDVGELASTLRDSRRVMIVPGYGMAVAQAQHPVRGLTESLRDRGVEVCFAIHPVAGRLPGHMNVLLAEAGLPYDIVHEMDEVNPGMEGTDVVLVIGANDIVNPSAIEDPTGPIAGMPVIEVWRASTVVVLKRGMATGYAGVENPLFFKENTRMLFGDAKQSVEKLLGAVRGE